MASGGLGKGLGESPFVESSVARGEIMRERAFLLKHDMLPGLKARMFRHKVQRGPGGKRCPYKFHNTQCEEEETLEHYFVTCPSSSSFFIKLRQWILSYTENLYRYPPVSNVQFLLGDFSAGKLKMRTAVWVLYSSLSKVHEVKQDLKIPVLEEMIPVLKEDMQIAKLAKSGRKLDEEVFDIFDDLDLM